MRHNKHLLEKVLRDELAMGMYQWSTSKDDDEETVLVLTQPFSFLESLSKTHISQKTTYEILRYNLQVKRGPKEKKVTVRLNLGHLEGILKPSFFVIEAPEKAGVEGVHVRYQQNNLHVTDEDGVVFGEPKTINISSEKGTPIPSLHKHMFLVQAPTKWPVGDPGILEKTFSLFRRDSDETNVLNSLLRATQENVDGHNQSVSSNTGSVSQSEQKSDGDKATNAYTVVGDFTDKGSDDENDSSQSNPDDEDESYEVESVVEEENQSSSSSKTTSVVSVTNPPDSHTKSRSQETMSSDKTGRNSSGKTGEGTSDISSSASSDVQELTSVDDQSSSRRFTVTPKVSFAADTIQPESSDDDESDFSETRTTAISKHTKHTQEVQVENGGIFYDSKKVEALGKLLPCMQGVTDNIFTVTLDLEGVRTKGKPFNVSLEVLAVRQCLK